jgi:DNA invertase Pin-like site-specific DNA recombinase
MKRVIAYLRVSSLKQDLENQKHEITEYCRKNDIEVSEWLEVEMSTRKAKKERRIDELLSKLKKGDSLIISELSRLGRSLSEVVLIIEELIKKQVRLVAIKQGITLNGRPDIATKTMIFMFSMFGEIERDMISQRTKMGLANAKAKGRKLGNPNFPIENKRRFEEAVKFAETLRPILEGFVARGMSQREMVNELNKLGIKTRHNSIWRLLQLQIVLKRLGLRTKRSTS